MDARPTKPVPVAIWLDIVVHFVSTRIGNSIIKYVVMNIFEKLCLKNKNRDFVLKTDSNANFMCIFLLLMYFICLSSFSWRAGLWNNSSHRCQWSQASRSPNSSVENSIDPLLIASIVAIPTIATITIGPIHHRRPAIIIEQYSKRRCKMTSQIEAKKFTFSYLN